MADENGLDVFPPRGLGGESDHWGRTVESNEQFLYDQIVQLKQQIGNQGRASSGTLGALSDQVSNITNRESYSTSATTTQTWNNEVTITNYAFGPVLTFSLEEARVVSITTYINGSLWARAGNGANSVARLRGGVAIDNVPTASSSGVIRAGLTNNAAYADQSVSGVVTARSLLTLAPGVHTVQAVLTEVYASTVALSGATGSATVEASNPFVFVDILQRA